MADSTPPRTMILKISRLPICDLIFCAISLILLIAETISLILTILYFNTNAEKYFFSYFAILLSIYVVGSLLINGVSVFWYLKSESQSFRSTDLGLHVCLHVFQLSLFWRYIILLRRINLESAKLLICELCSLRALHSVVISSISCIILLFFSFKTWFDVPILVSVTCALCFCDLCWSLSSFNRKCRRDKSENFVLCWPGILAQFFWRSGTIGSRVTALVIYASSYSYYVFIVVILHWILMVLGLVLVFPAVKSPAAAQWSWKNALKRFVFGAFLAVFYVLFFFNPSKNRTKLRFGCFYCVMFAENSLLASVWLAWSLSVDKTWTTLHSFVTIFVWFGFVFGIVWMILYYRYLHASVLSANLMKSTTNNLRRNSRQSSNNALPVVFACSTQMPFKKQPSKFRPTPLAPSASASSMVTTRAAIELAERRSRSVPAVNRKHRRRSRDEPNQHIPDPQRQHSNSYPKRYHDAQRIAALSSTSANTFRQTNEWSDSSDELSRAMSNSMQKTKRLRPTSVGSIILRTMDDDRGRQRIETVF